MILKPLRKSPEAATLLNVIDGLDECANDDHVTTLIHLLVDAAKELHFHLLFASRPEHHIQEAFKSHPAMTVISLQDKSYDDIVICLRSGLQKVKPPPSDSTLWKLAIKSEGIFMYASTLIRYVSDKRGVPRERLQCALNAHNGLDPLFAQVLVDAKDYDHFGDVLGAVIFGRHNPAIGTIGAVLSVSTDQVRVALRGCVSILQVPGDDAFYVRPYHT
jgi:hypothetical protein